MVEFYKQKKWLLPGIQVLFCIFYLSLSFLIFRSVFSPFSLKHGFAFSCIVVIWLEIIGNIRSWRPKLVAIEKKYNRPMILCLILLLAVIGTIAIGGSRAFFVPPDFETSMIPLRNRIDYFFRLVLWWIPVILAGIGLLEIIPATVILKKRKRPCNLTILLFILISCVWFNYLWKYWPGILSYDSVNQWKQAQGMIPLTDWHPVFHTLCIRFAALLYPSPAAYCILQILFGALVSARFFSWLLDRLNPFLVCPFILLFVVNPVNGIHMITVWKDIPYAISILWVVFILARLLANEKEDKSYLFYLETIVALSMMCLFRHNGTALYCIVLFVFCAIALRKKLIKYMLVCLSSALLVPMVNFCIRVTVNPEKTDVSNIQASTTMINDFLSVYYLGGNVPEKALDLIQENMDLVDKIHFSYFDAQFGWRYVYLHDGVHYPWLGKDLFHNPLLPEYIKLPFYAPKEFIQAFFMRTEIIWTLHEYDNGGVILKNYMGDESFYNELGLTRRLPNFNQSRFDKLMKITAEDSHFSFLWLISWISIICFILIIWLTANHQKMAATIFVPYFGNLLTLLFVSYNDFRLIFPNHLIFPFLLLSTLYLCYSKQVEKNRQRKTEDEQADL